MVPCKVYHPHKNGGDDKVLTANTQEELEALLRIGWKLKESK
jgi:hypothetical protein